MREAAARLPAGAQCPVLMVLCLALTALGLNNTYGYASELEVLAEGSRAPG